MWGFNIYRKRKKLEIDIEMQKYKTTAIKEVETVALTCAKQIGEYEHTFHSKREELGIVIAKIEASKESMTKEIENLQKIIEIKDLEIDRLNNICLESVEGKIIIQK
jgi:hypothetical protein